MIFQKNKHLYKKKPESRKASARAKPPPSNKQEFQGSCWIIAIKGSLGTKVALEADGFPTGEASNKFDCSDSSEPFSALDKLAKGIKKSGNVANIATVPSETKFLRPDRKIALKICLLVYLFV